MSPHTLRLEVEVVLLHSLTPSLTRCPPAPTWYPAHMLHHGRDVHLMWVKLFTGTLCNKVLVLSTKSEAVGPKTASTYSK